ncbi:MAG TPA: phosphate acyltransferase [Clostridia bacterium]|nr:phosphate acyltransferase [Clostridia bacterium]
MPTPAIECSGTAIANFQQLRIRAQAAGPKRVGVVVADDEVALLAAASAADQGIAVAVLFGDESRIRAKLVQVGTPQLLDKAQFIHAPEPALAANAASQMARDGKVDILLKGHLRTDELLRAALDKQNGLRTGRLLSDVLLYEDTLSGETRLVGMSDGGMNVAPTLEQKKQIVLNAVTVMHALGIARPKIAIMSATEVVTDSVPSTIDAKLLSELGTSGEFGEADVYGPLALDNALLESAAKAKGITNPVAGHADCMIVSNIEAGNLLGKAVKYLGRSQCAHVIVGARVPILIPSRVESVDDKLNSVALGVLAHGA